MRKKQKRMTALFYTGGHFFVEQIFIADPPPPLTFSEDILYYIQMEKLTTKEEVLFYDSYTQITGQPCPGP